PERPVVEVSDVDVNGATVTDFYVTTRGIRSGSLASAGSAWTSGATVTYSHGYAETDPQFSVFRSICIEAAARAFTMNERSAQGGALVESVGFAPQVFLTEDDKVQLREFMRGPGRYRPSCMGYRRRSPHWSVGRSRPRWRPRSLLSPVGKWCKAL